jgi:dienelactone hydrolase
MHTHEVKLPVGGELLLEGSLAIPDGAAGLVVFAHGSGSSRFSPRNQEVARVLQRAGLGTLLFDLLSSEEHRRDELDAAYRFDVSLLALRLSRALAWLRVQPATRALALGLFGASTGAAAALIAAAGQPDVRAVVSRGGRPDLAGEALSRVTAPTLLIVGELDHDVLRLNRFAAAQMKCEHRLMIVPGATHLFEEPGALETVAQLAAQWFSARLLKHELP